MCVLLDMTIVLDWSRVWQWYKNFKKAMTILWATIWTDKDITLTDQLVSLLYPLEVNAWVEISGCKCQDVDDDNNCVSDTLLPQMSPWPQRLAASI